MSSKKPPPQSTAAQAAELVALLGATDPAAMNERAGSAKRHFERSRRPKPARHAAGKPEAAGAASNPPPGGAARAAGGARGYLHAEPTRSPVLNAFLNELGGARGDLVSVDVHVFDEHTLAPRLVELARKRVISMLLAAGKPDVALVLGQMPPIANERAARLFMRQAVHVGGDLGAITRDYGRHHRRSGAPEHDDQRAGCIMATFAGRLNAMAEQLLGPHVRADVRAELAQLTTPGGPPARRRRASDLRRPQGAGQLDDAAPRALDAAGSSRRPRGR
ncbi:hypothetical protein WMF31_17960 [Sorangium sp. So ce1036]|uniref:hypothetical protein n=1 Tax=Sorangium sp. So ce1036 TaxID=3133328 RepID=UPI003F100967